LNGHAGLEFIDPRAGDAVALDFNHPLADENIRIDRDLVPVQQSEIFLGIRYDRLEVEVEESFAAVDLKAADLDPVEISVRRQSSRESKDLLDSFVSHSFIDRRAA